MGVEKRMSNSNMKLVQKTKAVLIKASNVLKKPVTCEHCGKERSNKNFCEFCFSGELIKEDSDEGTV